MNLFCSAQPPKKNMNFSGNRWVLLHHQVGEPLGGRGDHYDFMLSSKGISPEDAGLQTPGSEEAQCLWTWAIPINPLQQPLPLVCSADRLPDHRTAYLDYEGPISGNRGEVQQVASGNYEVVSCSEELIELRAQCNDIVESRDDGPFLVSLIRRAESWELCWSAMQ